MTIRQEVSTEEKRVEEEQTESGEEKKQDENKEPEFHLTQETLPEKNDDTEINKVSLDIFIIEAVSLELFSNFQPKILG